MGAIRTSSIQYYHPSIYSFAVMKRDSTSSLEPTRVVLVRPGPSDPNPLHQETAGRAPPGDEQGMRALLRAPARMTNMVT